MRLVWVLSKARSFRGETRKSEMNDNWRLEKRLKLQFIWKYI